MATPCTTIQLGSFGNIVMKLQLELYKKGYDPKGIDGVFGLLTESAVKSFQTSYGLLVDGIVSPLMWSILGVTDCTYYPTQCTTIQMGSTGDIVRVLQNILKKKGYYTGLIDGTFGASTDSSVRTFQTNNSLVVDGIVGPKTWYALGVSDCTYGVSQCSLTLTASLTIPS